MSAAQTAGWPLSDDLSAALSADNRREDAGMHADERSTCWAHQCWAEDCADHPMHTDPHSWILQHASRLVTS
jgi:hypothetical protein